MLYTHRVHVFLIIASFTVHTSTVSSSSIRKLSFRLPLSRPITRVLSVDIPPPLSQPCTLESRHRIFATVVSVLYNRCIHIVPLQFRYYYYYYFCQVVCIPLLFTDAADFSSRVFLHCFPFSIQFSLLHGNNGVLITLYKFRVVFFRNVVGNVHFKLPQKHQTLFSTALYFSQEIHNPNS